MPITCTRTPRSNSGQRRKSKGRSFRPGPSICWVLLLHSDARITHPRKPCQVGWFVSPDGELKPATCGKLSCPDCAPRKLRKYRDRIGRIAWGKMLTVTMPAGFDCPPGDDALSHLVKLQSHSWGILRQWLKRNTAMKDYAWTREVTKLDHPRPNLHLHILLNSKYIPTGISNRKHKSLLNQALTRAGFGSVFKLKRVNSNAAARYYVTKYLSKSSGATCYLPRYTRRFQTTVRDVRTRSDGWHFLPNSWFDDLSLFRMCTHGNDGPTCCECSEERCARKDAERASQIGTTLNVPLNLIPSRKKSVSEQLMRYGP